MWVANYDITQNSVRSRVFWCKAAESQVTPRKPGNALSAAAVGPGPGQRDRRDDPAVAAHGVPVVVPVRVLA